MGLRGSSAEALSAIATARIAQQLPDPLIIHSAYLMVGHSSKATSVNETSASAPVVWSMFAHCRRNRNNGASFLWHIVGREELLRFYDRDAETVRIEVRRAEEGEEGDLWGAVYLDDPTRTPSLVYPERIHIEMAVNDHVEQFNAREEAKAATGIFPRRRIVPLVVLSAIPPLAAAKPLDD